MSGLSLSQVVDRFCLTYAVQSNPSFEDATRFYAEGSIDYMYRGVKNLGYGMNNILDNPSFVKLCALALVTIASIAMAALSAPVGMAIWGSIAVLTGSFPFIDHFFAERALGQRAIEEWQQKETPDYPAGDIITHNPALLEQLIEVQKATGQDLLTKVDANGCSLYDYLGCYDEEEYDAFVYLLNNTLSTSVAKRKPFLVGFINSTIITSYYQLLMVENLLISYDITAGDFTPEEQQQNIWIPLAIAAVSMPEHQHLTTSIMQWLKSVGFDINVVAQDEESGDTTTVLEECDDENQPAIDILTSWGATG